MAPNVAQVAGNIHHNVPLMPFNLFTAINSPLFTGVLGFHALRVNNPVTGQYGLPLDGGKPSTDPGIFSRCHALVPFAEMVVYGFPGREIFWHHPPLNAAS